MDTELWVCIIALTLLHNWPCKCSEISFFSWGILTKASVAALSPAPVMGFQKKDNPEEVIKKRPEFFLASSNRFINNCTTGPDRSKRRLTHAVVWLKDATASGWVNDTVTPAGHEAKSQPSPGRRGSHQHTIINNEYFRESFWQTYLNQECSRRKGEKKEKSIGTYLLARTNIINIQSSFQSTYKTLLDLYRKDELLMSYQFSRMQPSCPSVLNSCV